MTSKLLTEAIGTFVLVLTIGLARVQEGVPSPLAVGVALMAVVYAGGHISGAHYNPAVTIAIWIRGAIPTREVVPYVVAQSLGALVAAFFVYKFNGFPLHIEPGEGVSAWKAVTGEAIMTFVLAWVILNVAFTKGTAGNDYFGIAIGGTVMGGAFALGEITGAAFNPAVGLMTAIFEPLVGYDPSPLAWIYAIGPVLGGLGAAVVYKASQPAEAQSA